MYDGDVSLEQIIEIAKVLREKSLARTMAGTVKEVLGTALCVRAARSPPAPPPSLTLPPLPSLAACPLRSSVGCTVNGEHPSEITRKIDDGEIEIPDEA